ncbi:MAG: hypothetical protein KJZ91_31690, partial [Myxococcales bacterium]|nr:hypothetical protein [Myxococcales bacterium]
CISPKFPGCARQLRIYTLMTEDVGDAVERRRAVEGGGDPRRDVAGAAAAGVDREGGAVRH